MNTNQPMAELFGDKGVMERGPLPTSDCSYVSTEFCSLRLGNDLLAFLARMDSDEADELARRVSLAAVRERTTEHRS